MVIFYNKTLQQASCFPKMLSVYTTSGGDLISLENRVVFSLRF